MWGAGGVCGSLGESVEELGEKCAEMCLLPSTMCVSSKSIIETPPVTVLRWMPKLLLAGPQPRLGRAPLLLLHSITFPSGKGVQPATATGGNAAGLMS